MNNQLKKFCKEVRPPEDHSEKSKTIIESLMTLLSMYSKFPIVYYVIGGGLGEKTSTCLKCDVDVTVYTPWSLDKVKVDHDIILCYVFYGPMCSLGSGITTSLDSISEGACIG